MIESHMQAHLVCSKGNKLILMNASTKIPLELVDLRQKQQLSMKKIKNNYAHSHHSEMQLEPKTRPRSENLLIKEHKDFTMTRLLVRDNSKQSNEDTKN